MFLGRKGESLKTVEYVRIDAEKLLEVHWKRTKKKSVEPN